MRVLPGDDVAAALAGGDVTLAPGDHAVVGTLVLDRPATLRGEPGARLTGTARDALIRVSADVTLDHLEVARVAGWGSLVVVTGGALTATGCRFVGASSAWRLAEHPTLEPDEAWMGAGVDVRGGGAQLTNCHLEGPEAYGISASGTLTGEVRVTGGRVTGCFAGVRTSARAEVRMEGVTVDACVGPGLEVAWEGRLRVRGGTVSSGGTAAVLVTDGHAELVSVRVEATAGSGVWAEGAAQVTLREVEVRGAAASGVVARGRSKVTMERCRVAEAAQNGIEALGAAEVVATETTVEAASVTVMATLAGVVRMERCEAGKPGEWEVWTDGAARVDLGRPATGRVEGRVPATEAEWRERLAAEDLRPEDREAVTARLPKRGVAAEDRVAWRLLGPPGLAARDRLVFGERVPHDVGDAALLAWTGDDGGALAGRRLVRLGPDLRARWSKPLDGRPLGVFTTPGRLWVALKRPGGSDVLTAYDDANGRPLGGLWVYGEVGAVRVDGDDVVVWGWDTTGHPTDRCSWRAAGRVGGSLGQAEAMAQGQVSAPPDERWDWVRGVGDATILPGATAQVRGAWLPGKHRAVLDTGTHVVTADMDGNVWLYDLAGTALAVRPLHPPARLLAMRGDDVLVGDSEGGGGVALRVTRARVGRSPDYGQVRTRAFLVRR